MSDGYRREWEGGGFWREPNLAHLWEALEAQPQLANRERRARALEVCEEAGVRERNTSFLDAPGRRAGARMDTMYRPLPPLPQAR